MAYLLADGEAHTYICLFRTVDEGLIAYHHLYAVTNLTILRLKAAARTALLTSKRTLDTNTKSRRDELLAGGVLNPKPGDENTCVLGYRYSI